MPPKAKITKDSIIDAAIEIIRRDGAEELNSRAIASYLNCSTQPIFSNFASMDELRRAVLIKADLILNDCIQKEIRSEKYPAFKASGMAYIRFAKEERELFKLLFMRNRSEEVYPDESVTTAQMQSFVQSNVGIDGDEAKLFHLEIWTCVHGIASMLVTDFLDLDTELISKMITDVYQSLKTRYEKEKR